MRRCAFNILAGTSLLLLLVTLVFWVRSYFVLDNPIRYTVEPVDKAWVVRGYSLISVRGILLLHRSGWLEVYRQYPWDSSTRKFAWKRQAPKDVRLEAHTLFQRLGF